MVENKKLKILYCSENVVIFSLVDTHPNIPNTFWNFNDNFKCDLCGYQESSHVWHNVLEKLKSKGYLEEDYPNLCCSCFSLIRRRAKIWRMSFMEYWRTERKRDIVMIV